MAVRQRRTPGHLSAVGGVEFLPETHRYRHVSYDPVNEGGDERDVSWEREWRIRTDSLWLDPAAVTFVVPFRSMVETLKEEHAASQRPEAYAVDDVSPRSTSRRRRSFPTTSLCWRISGSRSTSVSYGAGPIPGRLRRRVLEED